MTEVYVRKQDVIDKLNSEYRCGAEVDHCGLATAMDIIDELEPADVVQVVRCKDCKYNASTHKCLNPDSFFLVPNDNDFCSYGERKE